MTMAATRPPAAGCLRSDKQMCRLLVLHCFSSLHLACGCTLWCRLLCPGPPHHKHKGHADWLLLLCRSRRCTMTPTTTC